MKNPIKTKAPLDVLTEWVIRNKIAIGNIPPEEIAKKIQSKIV
jgi:hypothetical protein